MNIRAVLDTVRRLAPEPYQADWDNSGLQVAGPDCDVAKVAVALDPTPEALARCLDWGAQAVVTHHPLYLEPPAPTAQGPYLEALRLLLGAQAWLYACHTSLDCRPHGPAQWFGRALNLTDTRPLEVIHTFPPVQISFFSVNPLDEDTAGDWADLDGVWAVSQSSSQEVRIVCDEEAWEGGLRELVEQDLGDRTDFFMRRLEKPARQVGFGQIGSLPGALPWAKFEAQLAKIFPDRGWRTVGPLPDTVKHVAYLPGSGGSLVDAAFSAGADVFVTGDVKYHQALEASGAVVDVGHFVVEEEMMRLFCRELAEALSDGGPEVRFFPGEDPFVFGGNPK